MKLKSIILSAVALVALALLPAALLTASLHAQDAAAVVAAPSTVSPSTVVPSTDVTAVVSGVITAAATKFPWIISALSVFSLVSVLYQAVIAAAHKRAADTADLNDDKWLASLDAKPWFRILDRIFYWGGYLGSSLGGKKL